MVAKYREPDAASLTKFRDRARLGQGGSVSFRKVSLRASRPSE